MTDDEKLELAANVLHYGKALAPDRFPKPTELVLMAWGEALGSRRFPPGVWPEALRLWAAEIAGERMATPAELVRAARVVVERWESTPGRREQLRAFREARAEEREREWVALGGTVRPALEFRRAVGDGVLERARGVVGLPPLPGDMP